MLKLAVVVCVVIWSRPAEAIKWDFDDGTTQGWTAKEIFTLGGTREFSQFPGVVEDGVWRISVSPSVIGNLSTSGWSSVEVVSSTIGYDSGLFDQVRIRFRTVHDRPSEGSFWITWENYSDYSGFSDEEEENEPPIQRIVYTTEWQEVLLSLAGQDRWEGLLKNIRLSFLLDFGWGDVESFEIDWIELTGVEEQIEGELPPPHVENYFRFEGAGLFAPPVFYPIALGIGEVRGETARSYLGEREGGVLTDLDGDGDLDLFGLWEMKMVTVTESETETEMEEKSIGGWLMALNDGQGTLERGPVIEEIEIPVETNITGETVIVFSGVPYIEAISADLTGDGKDEIAIIRSNREPTTEVWSIEPELQIEVLAQFDDPLHSVADWDGDGRGEIFVGDTSYEGSLADVFAGTAKLFSELKVWDWDVEQGVWTVEEVAYSETASPRHIGDFTGDGILDVLWTSLGRGVNKRWTVEALGGELSQSSETFEFDEGGEPKLLEVGDFDGDGQVDFLTELASDNVEGSKGIVLQRTGAGDRLEAEVLYDDRLLRRSPVVVRDLNADGVEDWVFIGGDRVSGFGVFVEWGGGVNPTQQGERHRLEGSGRYVLCGDMDGDGDLDLVVLDPISGGVHVLKSSLSEQMTAVQTSTIARPAQYRLGDSYPNPFNPAVVLPLDLATDAAEVSLTVYDVLGRRVRQLWQGPLGAGTHRFVWDGRDAAGKAVAAGMYIYKVEVDGRIEAKKTTKLP